MPATKRRPSISGMNSPELVMRRKLSSQENFGACASSGTTAADESVEEIVTLEKGAMLRCDSMPLPKERLDRIVDIVLGIHAAGEHFLVISQMLVKHVDE